MIDLARALLVIRNFSLLVFAVGLSCVCVGCGVSSETLAPVSGLVRLDGVGLSNAKVVFEPPAARPSVGFTDAKGKFELEYAPGRPGALIGRHRVRITLDNAEPGLNEEGSETRVKLKVPAIYNKESELEKDVEAGVNVFTFDLKSEAMR